MWNIEHPLSYAQPFPAIFSTSCYTKSLNIVYAFNLGILLLCGDIEINPGPYTVLKCTKASFNQAHEKFGETRGIQCTCISLFGICFSLFKQVSRWDKTDIDYVIEKGDFLYKTQNTQNFLSCDELPRTVIVEHVESDIQFFENRSGILQGELPHFNRLTLFNNLQQEIQQEFSGILFLISGVAFSIIPKGNFIYLIDSHSRDELGRIVPHGTGIILKFSSFFEVSNYIADIYNNNVRNMVQYEIQFVKVTPRENLTNSDRRSLLRNRKTLSETNYSLTSKRKHNLRSNKNSLESKKYKRNSLNQKNINTRSKHDCVQTFLKKIYDGPVYICVMCNRLMYRKSVKVYYSTIFGDSISQDTLSYDGIKYICLTCSKKIKGGKIPPQAVVNKLYIKDTPDCLSCLNRLEAVLISQRLLFKKLAFMNKGNMPKIKGSICNIPVTNNETCSDLPRSGGDSVILVKLKKKLSFTGHVYFEPVDPQRVLSALLFLKENNPLYKHISVNLDNLSPALLTLQSDEENLAEHVDNTTDLSSCHRNEAPESNIPTNVDSNIVENIDKTTEDPLSSYRQGAAESVILPEPHSNEYIEIAPGEGKKPECLLLDTFCEELAFPVLLCEGKFGYQVKRDIKLSPTKYFNQRLLNYKNTFSSNSDYIFFAQFVLQQLNLSSHINIALKKVSGNVNAGMLKQGNFAGTVSNLIATDKAMIFMNHVKGSPAYWKRFQLEVLAMVRQLGCPTYFMTLSCADLRWSELISIISQIDKNPLSEEQINSLNYSQRCKLLNDHLVFVARHFQYKVELFFSEILMKCDLLGKICNYAIRAEYQFRGAPHIHAFIWIKDPPNLHNNIQGYLNFVDSHIQCILPDVNEELHELVKTYQVQNHSKSCGKYKNKNCRYHFERFFTARTIISTPLASELSIKERFIILAKRNAILSKVKYYIDEYLDPSKSSFVESNNISDILNSLQISDSDYYNSLAISASEEYEIHLKRPPNCCFVNNYNPEMLSARKANIDLQPVYNYYKAVAYMCAYFSKSESETSTALKQASQEVNDVNLNARESMRKLASAYATSRSLSLQEAVTYSLPELWLRKCLPKTIFVSTNVPSQRIRMCKSKAEIEQLDSNSTDNFKNNIVDRYKDRPNETFLNGMFSTVDKICLATFIANYSYADTDWHDNDFQPDPLQEFLDLNVPNNEGLPLQIPMMHSKQKLKLRKVENVLRYHIPNRHLHPESYAHRLLFLFYPFRDENDLLYNNSYCEMLLQPGIMETVTSNRDIFEPFSDELDSALFQFSKIEETYPQEIEHEQLLDDATIIEEDNYQQPVLFETLSSLPTFRNPILSVSDDQLRLMVHSLNSQQKHVFSLIYTWANDTIKYSNAGIKNPSIKPFHLFVTGGAGVGKSYLINTLFESISKVFNLYVGTPEKAKVVKLAPTGIASININGTTINTGLAIPIYSGLKLPKLSDNLRCILRTKYSDLEMLIIDEISMVSNVRLYHIHKRLCEIMNVGLDVPFGGISVIVVGDLYQLPPIRAKPVFSPYADELVNLSHPWHYFECFELTEAMRQQGDKQFFTLLNNIRTSNTTNLDIDLLNSRNIENFDEIPSDSIFLCAENFCKDEVNKTKLDELQNPEIHCIAVDIIPKGVSQQKIHSIDTRSQSQCSGLAKHLSLKPYAKVMLTNNIDIEDRLINGQIGTVQHVIFDELHNPKTIYVKFNDDQAGLKRRRSDQYAIHNNVVPICKIEANIPVTVHQPFPCIVRTQFPLMLSWASTVHKVQGLTLTNVLVSFMLHKQRNFNYGQIYVALSRVKSLSSLYTKGDVSASMIVADPAVTREYERMKNVSRLFVNNVTNVCQFSIGLLNIRSLTKHSEDLLNDEVLIECDVVCLTETQLNNNISHDGIQNMFQHHELIFHNNQDKFKSLAILRKSCTLMSLERYEGAMYAKFALQESPVAISLLLVYRSHTFQVSQFLPYLNNLISLKHPDIILGDFSINALDEASFGLMTLLSNLNYSIKVKEPTHIRGGLLDHVYFSKQYDSDFLCKVMLHSVYYSDHNAVILHFDTIAR